MEGLLARPLLVVTVVGVGTDGVDAAAGPGVEMDAGAGRELDFLSDSSGLGVSFSILLLDALVFLSSLGSFVAAAGLALP